MFLENIKTAASQVGILYVMVLMGFICDKTGIFTEKTGKRCTDLLFYLITPAVIVNSFLTQNFSRESATRLLISIGCGFLMHFIAIGINTPLFSKGNKDENCVYKYASIYGNVGYMTLPLTQALLGSEGVFYCSAVVMAFNVVTFTHGTFMMDKSATKFEAKKLILNPGVISVLIGVPFFVSGIALPAVIAKPVSLVASMQTPFAMIVFGTFLANTKFSTLFKNKKIFLVGFSKLIVLPAVMYVIYRLIGLSGNLLVALTISACAPSANNTVMFSAKFDKDTGLAAQTVAAVSFISVITIPVIIALVQSL